MTIYPDKITIAVISTNIRMIKEKIIRATVGLALGPKETALAPATLPRRDLNKL